MRSIQSSSIAPEPDDVVHLVLDDFGALGTAYRETDPAEAGEQAIIERLLSGEYSRPRSIVAFSLSEGWVRDMTADISRKVLARSLAEGRTLPWVTRGMVERALNADVAEGERHSPA
jgi:hypothetical protein